MTQTLCLSYSLLHLLNPPFTIKGQKGGKFSCHFLFTEKLLGFLLVTDKKIWNWHYKVRLLAIIHKFSISRKHQPGYVLQNFRHSYFFVSFAKFRKPWFFQNICEGLLLPKFRKGNICVKHVRYERIHKTLFAFSLFKSNSSGQISLKEFLK